VVGGHPGVTGPGARSLVRCEMTTKLPGAGLPTLLAECSVMEAHGHAAHDDARACAQALSDAVSSAAGSRTRSAPRARYRSCGKSALPIIGW
jgi:hypothetical protein